MKAAWNVQVQRGGARVSHPVRAARTRLSIADWWRGFLLGWLLFVGLGDRAWAAEPAREVGDARFLVVDIFVDSGAAPLAAYQVQFAVTNGAARIVGIEGGEPQALREPPYYDPKAIQHERAIIAGFSTAPERELPKGKLRVASVHLRTTGAQAPRFELQLQAAADSRGNRIAGLASYQPRKNP